MATRVRFDRFYTYAELQETLEAWAGEFPGLLRVESIGQSYEGREIPLATVTNLETRAPEEKPAVFIHAQLHAMEFTGTTAALTLDFKYDPKLVIRGGDIDWVYDFLGAFAWVTESGAHSAPPAWPTTTSSTGSAITRPRTTSRS